MTWPLKICQTVKILNDDLSVTGRLLFFFGKMCVCVFTYFSINLAFFGGVWLWWFGCWMIEAGRSWLRDQDFAHAAAFAEPGRFSA